ncbi:Trypanosoma vivax, partial [Trypanosoma grayi]|uniref:Trypanosoma vivax n=1 Tax=Trypanosoma grayi TaxID=71804 RepID=UPI0004F4141E
KQDAVAENSEEKVEDGNAAHVRRRWKVAAWLTARIFNEGSWHQVERAQAKGRGGHTVKNTSSKSVSRGDIVDAARRQCEKRLLHVDVHGMEIVGLVVALTSRYAYVAVPHVHNTQVTPQWMFVSRVPIPSMLATAATAADVGQKRAKNGAGDTQDERFLNDEELLSHDTGLLHRLPLEQRVRVTVCAHKVYCKQPRATGDTPALLSVAFEDAAVVSIAQAGDACSIPECFTTYADVLQIVRESCARFIRGYGKYGTPTAAAAAAATSPATAAAAVPGGGDGAVERLFAALTDTVSVRLKRERGSD